MDVNYHWYRSSYTPLTFLLLPFASVFRVIVSLRRALYRFGFKKTQHFDVPVIVVGNITVGGTGKTPFVIWLVNFLRAQGYRPGIVSRGYGGKFTMTCCSVTPDSDTASVGDEAVLLAKRLGCPMVVGRDRVAAVKSLLLNSDCNIVISDDGLQHYRLGRTLEIAIVDGHRRFGNQAMLPAGPLREPVSRLRQVDFVIAQQQAKPGEYKMQLVGAIAQRVTAADVTRPLASFSQTDVHAVAAIGNPAQFFNALRAQDLHLILHAFQDHYLYKQSDFDFGDSLPIIMTEKDAVKCTSFADERFWYLPVIAEVDENFANALLKKLGEIPCASKV
jgi:tetraacyldisaccharide 4'-kinase